MPVSQKLRKEILGRFVALPRGSAMSTKDKPNIEFEAPETKPTAEELYSDPAERIVFGTHGRMAGFWRLVIPLVVFLVLVGAFFATVS